MASLLLKAIMLSDILISLAAIGAVTVVRWGFKIYDFFFPRKTETVVGKHYTQE